MDLKITNPAKHFKTTPEINTGNPGEKAKLEKAAKEFESLFTSMMLKSMTKTTSGMFGDDSFGGDMFDSIFENGIASEVSKGKGIGIADFIYKELEHRYLKSGESGLNPSDPPGLKKLNQTIRESPVKPCSSSLERLGKYDDIIARASDVYGIDKNIIRSVILTESAANEKAVSKAKAKGLMQLDGFHGKRYGSEKYMGSGRKYFRRY